MAMQKIKKDDMVVMLAGRDRAKTGRVIKVIDKKRVVVEGLNMVSKHVKPNPQKNQAGGIERREASGGVSISNVAILNPRTNKADRVGFKILEDGKKVRYFKSDKEVID